MLQTFTKASFHSICDKLAAKDKDLAAIIKAHGYPPLWTRANTFETLIHIILEQQVSLASALSALNKLREKITDVHPEKLLQLTDEELKACYFSRQKTVYARHLAEALHKGHIDLAGMKKMPDDEVRAILTSLKGIGNWTVDVYLMFVLQRADIFPLGDLAAVNALKRVKHLPKDTAKEDLLLITEQWRPYRTVATMILWHFYLSAPRKK